MYKRLHEIADRMEPSVRRLFLEGIENLRDNASIEDLKRAIEQQNQGAILQILQSGDIYFPVSEKLLEAIQESAKDKSILPEAAALLVWDSLRPRNVQFLREYRTGFIAGVDKKTQEGIRQIIVDTFRYGGTTDDQAKRIINLVGLTDRQAIAVTNFRNMLVSEGKTTSQIERLVGAYRKRQLRYRANVIARTETIRAVNAGIYAAMRQALDEGLVTRIRRVWETVPDDRLCEWCASLDGAEVGMEDNYSATVDRPVGGPLTYTTLYPPLHPNCRCVISVIGE